jgi:hypothetical protein
MKAILEFDLDKIEDRESFAKANKAEDAFYLIESLLNELRRKEKADETLDINDLREFIYEFKEDRGMTDL